MAWKAPALTKATTATRGTNNFVLSDPASQGPYRTDVQANADGSLPTGSTVHYVAWRTTTTGDAEFEEGWGTYTLSTRVVARTAGNVIDGSAGPGTLVDFGLSGQMDVLFLAVLDGSDVPASVADAFADNIGAVRKNTGSIIRQDTNTAHRVDVQNADTGIAASAQVRTLADVANLTMAARSSTFSGTRFGVALANRAEVLGVLTALNIGTLGANNVLFGANDTLVAQITSAGVFQDASGNRFDAFPVGTVLLSESIPTGWNAGYVTDGRMIRLAKSGDTLGSQAGTDDPFDGAFATANHVLTITQIPAHTHSVPVVSGTGGSSVGLKSDGDTVLPVSATGSAGSGGGHSHTIATPNHRVMVRIVKA